MAKTYVPVSVKRFLEKRNIHQYRLVKFDDEVFTGTFGAGDTDNGIAVKVARRADITYVAFGGASNDETMQKAA